jgi:hypothetical protein
MQKTLDTLKVVLDTVTLETTKFTGGNKSAGTRARKASQEAIKLLRGLRVEIQAAKKAAAGK